MTINFDAAYYLKNNPDVQAAVNSGKTTALQHWITFGAKEKRNPNALFNTAYYLSQNPDVAASGVNPLTQFNNFGSKENRSPSALFDTKYYLANNPDVAAAVAAGKTTALAHYLSFGAKEYRSPSLALSQQFNGTSYLLANPDVKAALGKNGLTNALQHYMLFGAAEGRAAAPVAATLTAAVAGRAIDGYLSGATVFHDANGNGKLDAGEVSTKSNKDGSYFLAAGSGDIVVSGGTDITTKRPNSLVLRGTTTSTVVTPLTTLVNQAVASGNSLSAAQASVAKALGLSASLDISNYDPTAVILADKSQSKTAAQVQLATTRVANLLNLAASGIAGASKGKITYATAVQSAAQSLTKQLLAPPASATKTKTQTAGVGADGQARAPIQAADDSGAVDLNDSSFVSGFLSDTQSDAQSDAGGVTVDFSALDGGLATLLINSDNALEAVGTKLDSDGADVGSLLDNLSDQQAALDSLADQVESGAASGGDVTSLATQFSGDGLTALLDTAPDALPAAAGTTDDSGGTTGGSSGTGTDSSGTTDTGATSGGTDTTTATDSGASSDSAAAQRFALLVGAGDLTVPTTVTTASGGVTQLIDSAQQRAGYLALATH